MVEGFGYEEYDAPILEPLELFAAKTGEEIVNEQLYSFVDRGGRKVAIRPEMTPSVSRMVATRRQELAYPLRWYSIPNLWRYERPQQGRLREHWQLNVDLFGVAGIEGDIEIIQIADAIMKAFGAKPNQYTIKINSRKLVDDFLHGQLKLSGSNARKLARLMDKKNKISAAAFVDSARQLIKDKNLVAQLVELLNSKNLSALPSSLASHQSVKELERVFATLKSIGISDAVFAPDIMRGFDYYTDIVFEVYDTSPDNKRSLFGGGRYDGLVGMFGVEPVPTVGFGMGDVTLQSFLEVHKLLPKLRTETDAVAIVIGDTYKASQKVLTQIRSKGVNVAVDSSGRKLDVQIKNAVKSGVRFVIFVGKSELESGKFKLRDLEKGQEKSLTVDELSGALLAHRA